MSSTSSILPVFCCLSAAMAGRMAVALLLLLLSLLLLLANARLLAVEVAIGHFAGGSDDVEQSERACTCTSRRAVNAMTTTAYATPPRVVARNERPTRVKLLVAETPGNTRNATTAATYALSERHNQLKCCRYHSGPHAQRGGRPMLHKPASTSRL